MPTSQDDVRSRGEDWKSPVLYQMTRLTRSGSQRPTLQDKSFFMLGLSSTLKTSVTFAHCTEICRLEMIPL
jgi:hypothetical protein